jgi:hypothetical protein
VVNRSVPARRNYSDEEVDAILRRALERQLESGDQLGHEELIAAAREVGLDEEAVERAIGDIRDERAKIDISKRLRDRRRQRWVRHLVLFAAASAGGIGLYALGLAGAWAIYLAIVWAVFVAIHAHNGLRKTTDDEVEREQARLTRHARRKAKAEARREAKRRNAEERARREEARRKRAQAGEQLDRVIEEGVTLLLNAAANKIREATTPPAAPVPRTDFERFVARKKAEATGAPIPAAPVEPIDRAHERRMKVRVEAGAGEEPEEELESTRSRHRSSRKR